MRWFDHLYIRTLMKIADVLEHLQSHLKMAERSIFERILRHYELDYIDSKLCWRKRQDVS